MNYLERYLNGEYEQVWDELQQLGAQVFNELTYTEAQAVATETMRRVRENCERIVARLTALGYIFGTYPDGTRRSYVGEPITRPSDDMAADSEELEDEAGPIPLSLQAFWREVGAVDWVGMHPSWPDGLDPLVVDPPEGALAMLYDLDEYEEEAEGAQWFVGLAPDDLHKDNISGGDPYGLYLPGPAMDFKFMYEPHGLLFVQYLRLAILQWGGFPGLDGSGHQFKHLETLTADLVPF